MVSRRTRVASWIFRRDHPAAVNVLDVSSESMAAFQVFFYGRFWVFTEEYRSYTIVHK